MLQASEYDDLEAVDEMINGADLTGQVPVTGVLPGKFNPALLTDEASSSRATLLRGRGASLACSSGDPEVDAGIWAQTMEEVSAGWLEGPLEEKNVMLDHPISRRFGGRQGPKIRPIDDFSDSGVNHATTTFESPSLHTVDVIAAALTEWFERSKDVGSDPELAVRTYDLKSAYRQIGLSKKGREKACIAVFDPQTKSTKLFRLRVLPFGAVRSVHSFLRVARAIWHLGANLLNIMWSNFYDDYVVWTTPCLSKSTSLAIESLFKLTGWIFAESGSKCVPFGKTCQALGIELDMSQSAHGVAYVRNTPNRVAELSEVINSVVCRGTIPRIEARRLRGRMQFAESQLFGRVGKRCLKALSDISDGVAKVLSDKDLFFLGLFSEFLKSSAPREVSATSGQIPVIFTDACYESDATTWICGIGGVIKMPNLET